MKLFNYRINTSLSSAILLFWVITACIIPNIWLSFSEPLTPVQALANTILPLGFYLWLMTRSTHIGRTSLWMIFFMFFAAFQLVLLHMYGRSVIAVDMFLNLVTTNPGEVAELLGNMTMIILAVIVIYLVPIITAIVATVRRWRLTETFRIRTARASYCCLGLGLCAFILSFILPGRYNPLTDLFPANALANVAIAADRTAKMTDYMETSGDFSFNAATTHPDSIAEIYVAVIGETSRSENWQLFGYDKPTTPELMGRSGLAAFPRAFSQSNTTHKSVPMLMSHLDATSFGDSIYHVKSFITAFNEAGFRTAFISNQKRNHSFIDFFGEEADTCIFIRDDDSDSQNGNPGYDTDLLPYLDRLIGEGHRKLLVVMHTYGSHFNYYDRYPRSMARFMPDGPTEASESHRPELLNAYDNSVALTSSLLASIMDRLEASGTSSGLIYTSDHGEDIYDDERRLFLHASPCPSFYQIHVPMLVWTSGAYRTAFPAVQPALEANSKKFVASSAAYFHTLMEVAGIATPRLDSSASLASPAYVPQEPRYLNDHNQCVSLSEAGFLKPDFILFDSININK